jgi:hypothetical protein
MYCIDYLRNKLSHRKLIMALRFLEVFDSEEMVTCFMLCIIKDGSYVLNSFLQNFFCCEDENHH